MDTQVEIRLCGTKPLIFKKEDVERLRCQHRIVGALIGALPRLPLQNAYPGLPLLLTPEETTLLISKDLAVMNSATGTSESWAFPKTDLDRLRYRVFEYLWSKQLYITRGLKFGGDFMAYPGDPMRFHSHYIVLAMERDAPLALLDMISKGRLAVNVKKTFVIAGPAEQESCDDIETFSIQWAGF